MKIPFIPVHVVTSKTLGGKIRSARAEGVTEGRNYSNHQIEILLNRRARKPIRLKTKGKQVT